MIHSLSTCLDESADKTLHVVAAFVKGSPPVSLPLVNSCMILLYWYVVKKVVGDAGGGWYDFDGIVSPLCVDLAELEVST